MTRVCATGAIVKPKATCRINNCTKEYSSKSYLKKHQTKVHQLAENDDNAEADMDDDENIEDDIDDDLSGGTQVLIDVIEDEVRNEAVEAEVVVVGDKLLEALETDLAYYSMVSHMVTGVLFQKQVSPCVLDVLAETGGKQVKAVVKEKTTVNPECDECDKRKEVEENQEELLKKSEKENKIENDKLKSMAGQKRFHVNKSKALAKEIEDTRRTLGEMQKRISVLELEKSTLEALKNIAPPPPLVVSDMVAPKAVPEAVPETVPEAPTEEQVVSPQPTTRVAKKVKCRKCKEEREDMTSLSEHMKVKHPSIQYKCDKCHQKYPFMSALRNHFRIAHPAVVHSCNVCKTVFVTKLGLDNHRSTKCKTPAAPVQQHVTANQVTSPEAPAPQVPASQVPVQQVPAPSMPF